MAQAAEPFADLSASSAYAPVLAALARLGTAETGHLRGRLRRCIGKAGFTDAADDDDVLEALLDGSDLLCVRPAHRPPPAGEGTGGHMT